MACAAKRFSTHSRTFIAPCASAKLAPVNILAVANGSTPPPSVSFQGASVLPRRNTTPSVPFCTISHTPPLMRHISVSPDDMYTASPRLSHELLGTTPCEYSSLTATCFTRPSIFARSPRFGSTSSSFAALPMNAKNSSLITRISRQLAASRSRNMHVAKSR